MKIYVLVKVYGLVVDDVELFSDRPDAEIAFFKWTGLTEAMHQELEEEGESYYSETKILEVDVPWIQINLLRKGLK